MAIVQVRRATSGDADAMGRLHVASWRETYAGHLPDAMLAALSVASRIAMWRTILDGMETNGVVAVLVAEDRGEVVALASCCCQRDAELRAGGFDGEVSALYLRRSHQRSGLGRALMRRMGMALADQGFKAATVWVLQDNSGARAFYERLGGERVAETMDTEEGVSLTELAYGWRDLSGMIGADPGVAK